MDPRRRGQGQTHPISNTSFPRGKHMHAPAPHRYTQQDRLHQRLSPRGSPSPMDLDSASSPEPRVMALQPGFGQNPHFQAQSPQLVGQESVTLGHGGMGQFQGHQGLPGDLVPDCWEPGSSMAMTSSGMVGDFRPGVVSPMNMVVVPGGFSPMSSHLGSVAQVPHSSVRPDGVMLVPQVGVHPGLYPGVPPQFLPPESAGPGQAGLLGQIPVGMEQLPGARPVLPVPPPNNLAAQPTLGLHHLNAVQGGDGQVFEFGALRQEEFSAAQTPFPQEVRIDDSAGQGGLQHVVVSSATPMQNLPGAVGPLQQGPDAAFPPGWIKEQLSRTIQTQPVPLTIPAFAQNANAFRPSSQSMFSRCRANAVDARFRSLYPLGFPSPPRSSVTSIVRTGGPVRFSPVLPRSMMQHDTGLYGCRSLRCDSSTSAVDWADMSSLRLNSTTVSGPSPMEMDVTPVLPTQKAPSLLDVRLSVGEEKGRTLREVVGQFVREKYRDLWHCTYCVPQKPSVSQQHPDKALVRTREGEFRVALALEQLSMDKEEHMFVLADYHYESFLHHLSPSKVQASDQPLVTESLSQLRKEQQFGDFDLLVFHPVCGLLVLGLCSVNSNSDVQYILKRVQKARNQLDKSAAVAKRYVTTLGLSCPVTRIFCTPNLKSSFLSRVTARDKHTDKALQGIHVMCSEQLPAQFRQQWLSMKAFNVLLDWWAGVKDKEQKAAEGQLTLDDLKLLLGCFLCPTLSKVDFDQSNPPPPSENRPQILESSADSRASPDTGHMSESSQAPLKEFDVSNLYLSIGSITKPFTQFMEEYVSLYFPDLTRTYRVPPIHFNIQKIGKEGSYDLLETPMSKDTRGDEGENRVVSAIEILGLKYEAVRPVFIICDFQYNNYLNKLKENMFVKGDDRRPRRAYGQSVRAQHDCLLIHRRYGIIIISVKAVGDNFDEWANTGTDKWTAVKKTLGKVLKQLPREQSMVNMVLGDLTSADIPCIKLVALPNLSHQDVDTAVSDDEKLKEEIQAMFPKHGTQAFLCKDELCETKENIWETYEQRPEFFSNLCRWWDRSVGQGRDNVLTKQLYRQIIGRFCGLLSTVEVWSTQSPRAEVRTLEEAVQETAERYSRILLTQEQLQILQLPSSQVFLSGPPGTGKTLLLLLRAQRWVEEGGQVVILNLRHGSVGLPLGHLLQQQVMKMVQDNLQRSGHPHDKDGAGGSGVHSPKHHHHVTTHPSSSPSSAAFASSSAPSTPSHSRASPSPLTAQVRRIDLDVRVFDTERPGKLLEIPEGALVVADEVTRLSHRVLSWVMKERHPQALWCAGQFEGYCPEGFEPHHLSRVLRCPPMVQRILQHTSYELGQYGKETRTYEGSYVHSSAPYGLSTDGARPLLILHARHNSSSRLPANCATCGNELGDYLLNSLHLQTSTFDQVKRRKLGPIPVTSGSLSLTDVVIVCRQVEPCPFVTALKKRGLTVSVVTDTANPMVAMPLQETIVFTSPFALTGLEKKVVVYVPFESIDPLKKEEMKAGGKEGEEVAVDDLRVSQALQELTSEDRVSLWYTASRCTSQLVIVVP